MSTTNTPTSYVGKHIFTQEEKNQKTEQMLQAMRQKEEIEAEFKTSKSNYKSKIDSKEAEIKLTANLLNAGFEDRTYSCLLTKDFEAGKRLYHEIGSNKLVGEEPLTAGDYQMQLDMDNKAIKAHNEAADLQESLLHTGEDPEPFEISAEDIAAAEKGPEYTVEPDSNPLEINEETPAVEPEVISKPTKQKGEAKQKVEPKQEPKEPLEDPFGMDDPSDDEDDPFNFGDI